MKITIVQLDDTVVVDGEARKVDLRALDQEIHAVQFDTERGTGKVEFDPLATEEADERDMDAEQAQEKPLRVSLERDETELEEATVAKDVARKNTLTQRVESKRALMNNLQPIMRKVRVPRRQVVLDQASFAPYQSYVDAWRDAAPAPVTAPTVEATFNLDDLVSLLKTKGIFTAAEVTPKGKKP